MVLQRERERETMGRLIVLVLYTFLSMCASSSSSSSSSKSSSESLNGGSTSKRYILPHTIHFSTGGAAHGEGSYGGGGRSPEIGQGGEGGSGSSTPKVPSSAAVIPVIAGGGAINNHHVGHPSDASRISVCSRLQTLVTIMLASCCIFRSRI